MGRCLTSLPPPSPLTQTLLPSPVAPFPPFSPPSTLQPPRPHTHSPSHPPISSHSFPDQQEARAKTNYGSNKKLKQKQGHKHKRTQKQHTRQTRNERRSDKRKQKQNIGQCKGQSNNKCKKKGNGNGKSHGQTYGRAWSCAMLGFSPPRHVSLPRCLTNDDRVHEILPKVP